MNRRRLPKSALILTYLQVHLGEWVSNEDLRRVSGNDDAARTTRQLRQDGWDIEKNGKGSVRLKDMEPGQPNGVRGQISGKLRLIILDRDDHRCQMCGNGDRLVVDHIIPVDAGGPTIEDNLQTLCERCNREKGSSIIGIPRLIRVLQATLSPADRKAIVDALVSQAFTETGAA